LGIPIGFLKEVSDEHYQFHDLTLNKEIRHAYHAVAIDEQRSTFDVSLWAVTSASDDQTVEQVWFAGVHSDVGGGYKERHHSDIAFKWMLDKIRDKVDLDDSKYPYAIDVSQNIHDSYKFYYGSKKRRVADATDIYTPHVHHSVEEKLKLLPSYKALALVDIDSRPSLAPYHKS